MGGTFVLIGVLIGVLMVMVTIPVGGIVVGGGYIPPLPTGINGLIGFEGKLGLYG